MIKASIAQHIGTVIKKSNQSALHADGITPLVIVGETHIMLSRDNIELASDAYLVNELDVDILAGTPFMSKNDISFRPAKQQILIGDTNIVRYGTSPSDSPNHVRRTQAYILKPEATSVIWPGNYLELALPSDLQPECTLAIESRTDNVKFLNNWTPPSIIEAVSGKVRIPNNADEPLSLPKNEHFAKSASPQNSPVTVLTVTYNYPSRLLLLQNSILTPSLLIPTRYFLSRTKPSFVL